MKKRLTRNAAGDPVLTIIVQGTSDVYRMGFYLQRAAVEHAHMGRLIHASLRRMLGAASFAFIQRQMHGKGDWR